MRLLNVNTLQLEEFFNMSIPPYAILSHTWGEDEETFEDFQRSPEFRPRSRKIIGCCEQTKKHNLAYAWIDTICIDKSSSAELSEAINSMFAWYAKSEVCFAYLVDVDCLPCSNGDTVVLTSADTNAIKSSRWFTRGWTLQELLAPSSVRFFTGTWKRLGRLDDHNDLALLISSITRIPPRVLQDGLQGGRREKYSVAKRMSWAAGRQTTRVEDEAYCLMGLFGVNMALLYGEGRRAFIRLQEEIIRRSTDRSIFAARFGLPPGPELTMDSTTALAATPHQFRRCSEILEREVNNPGDKPLDDIHVSATHTMLTNNGILLNMPVMEMRDPFATEDSQWGWDRSYMGILSCTDEGRCRGSPGYECSGPCEAINPTDHKHPDNILVLPLNRVYQNQLIPSIGNPPAALPHSGLNKTWRDHQIYLQDPGPIDRARGLLYTVCLVSLDGFQNDSVPRIAATYPSPFFLKSSRLEGLALLQVIKDIGPFTSPTSSVFLHYTSTTCDCRSYNVCICGCEGIWPDFAVRIEFTRGESLMGRSPFRNFSCSILKLRSRYQLFDMLNTTAAVRRRNGEGQAGEADTRHISLLAHTTAQWRDAVEFGRYTCSPSVLQYEDKFGLCHVKINLRQRVGREASIATGQSEAECPWFRDLKDLQEAIHAYGQNGGTEPESTAPGSASTL